MWYVTVYRRGSSQWEHSWSATRSELKGYCLAMQLNYVGFRGVCPAMLTLHEIRCRFDVCYVKFAVRSLITVVTAERRNRSPHTAQSQAYFSGSARSHETTNSTWHISIYPPRAGCYVFTHQLKQRGPGACRLPIKPKTCLESRALDNFSGGFWSIRIYRVIRWCFWWRAPGDWGICSLQMQVYLKGDCKKSW